MIVEVRRAQILDATRHSGGVGLRELSRRFGVSIPTVRRDLSALADRGLVRRVHGGAMPLPVPASRVPASRGLESLRSAPFVGTPPPTVGPGDHVYVGRRETGLAAAADLVAPGMAVGISGGPGAIRLARLLSEIRGLTVVTPAPAIALALSPRTTTVVLVGGVRTAAGCHAGPVTERTLQGLNLDIAFVEMHHPLAERTNVVLLERAARRVFLADPPQPAR